MEEVKMFPGVETDRGDALTDAQRAYLTDLTERYTTATAASRQQVAADRAVSADPRMISGFKTLWKEMVYPIVSRGSKGARLVDVDGNEYVDFTMGYGSILYGHAPAFVTEALQEQLERGFELGPMTDGIGETARRLCAVTGHDRAFFVSTGSEAMMAAIRIARTVTGRSKIAVFNGAYHGNFDEVNVRANFAGNGVVPGYPGIPDSASDEIILVEYGDAAAFDTLEEHADELAAVLVEPVQSRRPNLQPKSFLHELRTWTAKHRIALVFDEMITGFRCHPGGAQGHFGVKADLAAYGKILGGGLPIGAVAGASRFMDTIDGGLWAYGDDSVPAADLTYYEGTHRRHPLAMTAARAILQQIEEDGPELQGRLNARTEALAARLTRLFAERGVDFDVVRFASLFRIQTPPGDPLAKLFFYHMRLKGMYVWDQRNHFVSPAHSDADLDRFVEAARESLDEMIAAGVLDADPTAEPDLSISGDGMPSMPVASARKDLPLTDGQREIWTATQMEERANSVYNESIALNLTGAVNMEALESAAQFIVDRHEALRTTFAADGSAQTVHPSMNLPVHVEQVARDDLDARLQEQHAAPFDLEHGPLVRCALFHVDRSEETASGDAGNTSVLIWTAHHLVADGWSLGIIVDELATVYTSLDTGTVPNLEPATPLDVLVDADRKSVV
jgi:glutamate-1-semialdehyde aminotransferase